MRQVTVVMAWITNAFENSSQYSEYYLDLQNGDVKFYSPMDFPEHEEAIKKLDKQSERFTRLPKLEKDFSLKIKMEYVAGVEDQELKNLLGKNIEVDAAFRKVLMEYEDARRKWYKFQNKMHEDYLREWFGEKGIELVEKQR